MNFADRVKETSTILGTGTLNLTGASFGYQGFVAGIGDGNKCYYAIRHHTVDEWEVGIGTVTDAATDTLSRDSVIASSNSGALVSFTAGVKDVLAVAPALALDAAQHFKQPVRVATTADGTLATAYENGDTIDGIVLATGDRILLKDQSTGAENGIYIVAASGAPARSNDSPTGDAASGISFYVDQGTANADTRWHCTNNSGSDVVGTDALTFAQFDVTGTHTHATADVTSGTFADARIAESSVTQHEAAIDHDLLTNYVVGQHRTINDAGSATTDLWSADRISTDLAGKAASSHSHAASDVTSGTLAHERGGLEADVSAYAGYILVTGGTTSNVKLNHAASAAPGLTDDSASGYVIGSRWIDTTAKKEYVCLDATATSAVWTETTGAAGGGDVTSSANITDNAIVRGDGGAKGVQKCNVLAHDDDSFEFPELAGDTSGNPASGAWDFYFKADGPYFKDDAGSVTGPLGTGGGGGSGAAIPGNFLINGGFDHWQRTATPGTAVAMADDSYDLPDRWYSLIQSTDATIERGTGDSSVYAAKLIAGGATNRFGIAQIVPTESTVPLQGRTVIAQCQPYINLNAGSGSVNVRISILGWSGTADAVTSEVVNDWTSGTFTTSNFFASTTLSVIATGNASVTHGSFADLSVSGTVGASDTNIIVLIHWEAVPANAADYLIVAEAGLYDGSTSQTWLPRPTGEELKLCERYLQILPEHGMKGAAYSTALLFVPYEFPTRMRAAPTLSHNISSWITSAPTTTTMGALDQVSNAYVTSASGLSTVTIASGTDHETGFVLRLQEVASGWGSSNGEFLDVRLGPTARIKLDAEL